MPDIPGRRDLDETLLKVLKHVEEIIEGNNESHTAPCKHLLDAVPEGDLKGHCDYHENTIEWNKRIAQIRWAVVTAVAVTGTVGFIGWVGLLIWAGVLHGPAK